MSIFFVKQRTACEMRIIDWSSDVCSSDLVFYSGTENEANAKTGGAKSGDDRAFMLAHYNATLAAIDMDTGRARTIVDARTEPRPGSLQVSPSGRWISYRSVPYREEEISTVHVMDLAVVSAAGGDPRMIADRKNAVWGRSV